MKKEEVLEWVKTILISVVIAFLITTFLIKPTIVRQESMKPTLNEYDFLLINRWTYRQNLPKQGEIIVFESNIERSWGGNQLFIKRVIATPGDSLLIQDGYVYINGEVLTENYTLDEFTEGKDFEGNEIVIPEGMIFAMGDNRYGSQDSRNEGVGLILIDDIVGKAFVRLFPFNKIGLLK